MKLCKCSQPVPNSRRHDQVVVYSPVSNQLVVRKATADDRIDLSECPYCHRPMHEESPDSDHGNHSTSPAATMIGSPQYFRTLQHSTLGSSASASSPEPAGSRSLWGRLSPAVRVERAKSTGHAQAPPTPPNAISSSAFSPDYFNRFFREQRVLGSGGKGVVLLVEHQVGGLHVGYFALKRIPVGNDHEWLEKVFREVQILQKLSHQNLVSYCHVWLEDFQITPFGPSTPCAFILQEYCNGGDLQNYICSTAKAATPTKEQLKERMRRRSKHQPELPEELHGPRKLSFEEICLLFKDITAGVNYLHINGYIHRDLKPQNCLLHKTGNKLKVLISDFGEVQDENTVRNSTGATGTVSYCAPEVLRKESPSGAYGNFTFKSDVFSLGMILHFLCFANLPYRNADIMNEENEDINKLKDEIAAWAGLEDQKSLRPDLPDKLYKSLQWLLSLDPNKRPSAEEILRRLDTLSGLEESSELRSRSGGSQTIIPKIQSVHSTPTTSSGLRSPGLKKSMEFGQSGPPAKLRVAPFPKSSITEFDEKERVTSPGGSLVLRSRHSSPTKELEAPNLLLQSLLSARDPTRSYANDAVQTIKLAFLIIKIVSLFLMCMPVAADPWVAAPLLSFAILDLLLLDSGLYVSLLLLILHGIILFVTSRRGALCVSKSKLWEVM